MRGQRIRKVQLRCSSRATRLGACRESHRSSEDTGRTLYILDEPTTGLHFDDVRKLLDVLARLVDAGNSVIVIEHNLDVIKTSDWVVDLGLDGGPGGGHIVATGPPEIIARTRGSHTGYHLKPLLARSRGKTRKKAARTTASASRS